MSGYGEYFHSALCPGPYVQNDFPMPVNTWLLRTSHTPWQSYMAHKSSFYPPASFFNMFIYCIFQQIVSRACLLCAGISDGILGKWRGGRGRDGRVEKDSSPRRRRESFHTTHSLGWGWGSEQQRILFLAEAKPSGDSTEASLFLLLEFCAGAINPPNELRSLGKLHWSLVKKYNN